MIEDVYFGSVPAFWIGTNEGAGGSSSGTSASLLVFLPNTTVSAQVTSSLANLSYWGYNFAVSPHSGGYQIAPWSVEWDISAGIVRYVQSPAVITWLDTQPATIEHVANCVAIQFVVYVSVFPDSNLPAGEANASASALATATIFIES